MVRRLVVALIAFIVTYVATLVWSVPAARTRVADACESRAAWFLFPPALPAPDPGRSNWAAEVKAAGGILESRHAVDVLYERNQVVFPGVVRVIYSAWVNGRATADTSFESYVVWYGPGVRVVASITGNGLRWGPPV